METALHPLVVNRDAGETLWFFGGNTWVKATGADTGGAYMLVEQLMPPGTGSPWHVHHAEDESFYVMEGTLEFIVGTERIIAGPGTYVFGPRDIPHGFRVTGEQPTRMLLMTTPAGFEDFLFELSEPATTTGFPPAAPPDMPKVMAAAAKRRLEILGPLPD